MEWRTPAWAARWITRSKGPPAKAAVTASMSARSARRKRPVRAGLGRDPVELGETRLLEGDVVIVVDHVEAGDRVAARHQRARGVEADEPRRAGDEDAHPQAGTPRPRPMA